jgi:hypothetical protein
VHLLISLCDCWFSLLIIKPQDYRGGYAPLNVVLASSVVCIFFLINSSLYIFEEKFLSILVYEILLLNFSTYTKLPALEIYV